MVNDNTETKKPAFFDVVKYLGRELQGEGQKKDGSKYKRFLLRCKLTDEQKYPRTYTVFEPMNEKSIQLKELQEGLLYTIGYTEDTYLNKQLNKEVTSRTVFYLQPAKAGQTAHLDEKKQQPINLVQQQAQAQARDNGITETEARAFVKEYKAASEPHMRGLTHFIGIYVRKKGLLAETVSKLKQAYEDDIECIVHEEPVKG